MKNSFYVSENVTFPAENGAPGFFLKSRVHDRDTSSLVRYISRYEVVSVMQSIRDDGSSVREPQEKMKCE